MSARDGHHSQAPLARALLELHSALVALIVLGEGVPKLGRRSIFFGGGWGRGGGGVHNMDYSILGSIPGFAWIPFFWGNSKAINPEHTRQPSAWACSGTTCNLPLVSREQRNIWGFPKIRGILLGVPIIRTIVFWGLYWGSLILGKYHIIQGLKKDLVPLFPTKNQLAVCSAILMTRLAATGIR